MLKKLRSMILYAKSNGFICAADQIFNQEEAFKKLPYGVTRKKRPQKVIVSLTSYPDRINSVHLGVISLLKQTEKPDEIILWLAPEQFPQRERDLPKGLMRLKKYGLTIKWYKDIKSYKKLIPALAYYPNDVIVTADDDNIYPEKWLETLWLAYSENPAYVQCHRATKILLDDSGNIKTIAGGKEYYEQPSFLNKLTGLGGVLYPPHCFHSDISNEKLFMKLAPTSDDIWFWLMAALNDVRVNVAPNPLYTPNYIPGTQEGSCLCKINDYGEQLFTVHLNNILNYYPGLREKIFSGDK